MAVSESSRVGRRGTFVIPAKLRRRFGLDEGSEVIAEETPEGILLRPAVTVPMGFLADGLPAGLQILGRTWAEGDLIRFAYAYEQATRHRRPPPLFPELEQE